MAARTGLRATAHAVALVRPAVVAATATVRSGVQAAAWMPARSLAATARDRPELKLDLRTA